MQECNNEKVNNYLDNIKLIDFLKSISDYKSQAGSDLELFFLSSGKRVEAKDRLSI